MPHDKPTTKHYKLKIEGGVGGGRVQKEKGVEVLEQRVRENEGREGE